MENIGCYYQRPHELTILPLLSFLAGKYSHSGVNTTLIRPTLARKGRIRPFCVNTAHSISSADSTGFQDIFRDNISAAVPSLRQQPSRSAKENTNRFLDSIYDVDYQGKGAQPPEVGFGTQHVRGGRGIKYSSHINKLLML